MTIDGEVSYPVNFI